MWCGRSLGRPGQPGHPGLSDLGEQARSRGVLSRSTGPREGPGFRRLPPPASLREASPATHRRPRRVGVGHGSPAVGPSRAAGVSGPVPSREGHSSRRDSRSAAPPARRRGDRCSRGRFPLRSLDRDPHDRSHGPRPRSAGDTGRPRFQSLPVEFDSHESGSTGRWRDRAGPRLEPLPRPPRGWPRPPRRFRGPGPRRTLVVASIEYFMLRLHRIQREDAVWKTLPSFHEDLISPAPLQDTFSRSRSRRVNGEFSRRGRPVRLIPRALRRAFHPRRP